MPSVSLSHFRDLFDRLTQPIHGYIDRVTPGAVEGWVRNSKEPRRRLLVDLVVKGNVCASATADLNRSDLRHANIGDGRYGFRLNLPASFCFGDEQKARVVVRDSGYQVSYRFQKEIAVPPPLPVSYIAADIVNNCNLRCPFCLVDYSEVKKTELMSAETFRKLLTFLPHVPEGGIWLSCLHEPTIHPRFNSLLKLIPEGEGRKFWFTTNLAAPIPDSLFECWAAAGLHHVNVSLDTLDPDLFKVLRKHGRLSVFLDNLRRMVRIFKSHSTAPKVRYISMVFESNFSELEAIVRRCHDEWLAAEHEVRYMYNVEHVTDEFRRKHLPARDRWQELESRLGLMNLPHVIAFPPERGYEEQRDLPANYFEIKRYAKCPQPPDFTPPLQLRVRPGGNVHLVGQEDRYALNLEATQDAAGEILALARRCCPPISPTESTG